MPTKLASQIRLKGQWLKRSGFPAGSLAKVTIVSPGVLDIRLVTQSETPEQMSRLQVMQRLDSAIAFVNRAAVAKGRAVLEAELISRFWGTAPSCVQSNRSDARD